jgi:hypothetical protein
MAQSSRRAVSGVALMAAAVATALGGGLGCGEPAGDLQVERQASPVIYGADDRREWYQLHSEPARAQIAQAMVALIPLEWLRPSPHGPRLVAPPAGQRERLCPGERFAEQPAAAFCSGVLVDWDLVLTAGHCAQVAAPDRYAVVFGYHYAAPGELADLEVRRVVEIVGEAVDGPDVQPRLDYAWLRLDRPVAPPRLPAPVVGPSVALAINEPLMVVGASDGLPLKVDRGARVRDARSGAADYFVADSDTSHGSSGGGAFDGQSRVRGILARGQPDLVQTEQGCNADAHQSGIADGGEQFTHAYRAVERLCQVRPEASSLCRPACGDPCEALPRPAPVGGCAYPPGRPGAAMSITFPLLVLATGSCGRGRRSRRRRG